MKEHRAKINSVVFSNDESIAASASDDGACILWDMSKCSRLRMLKCFNNAFVKSALFHPADDLNFSHRVFGQKNYFLGRSNWRTYARSRSERNERSDFVIAALLRCNEQWFKNPPVSHFRWQRRPGRKNISRREKRRKRRTRKRRTKRRNRLASRYRSRALHARQQSQNSVATARES